MTYQLTVNVVTFKFKFLYQKPFLLLVCGTSSVNINHYWITKRGSFWLLTSEPLHWLPEPLHKTRSWTWFQLLTSEVFLDCQPDCQWRDLQPDRKRRLTSCSTWGIPFSSNTLSSIKTYILFLRKTKTLRFRVKLTDSRSEHRNTVLLL